MSHCEYHGVLTASAVGAFANLEWSGKGSQKCASLSYRLALYWSNSALNFLLRFAIRILTLKF